MKKMLFAGALAAAAVSVTALQAQNAPQRPGAADVSRVTGGTYKLDSAHTLILWRANHFGFSDYLGIFGDVTGTLEADPNNIEAAKLDITVPIASVTVANQGLRDHLLRPGQNGGNPDFFGAEPAPARFVSTGVKRTGDMTADITGDLTMNGVTRPVTIQARFQGAGSNPMSQVETVGFVGTTTLRRSEFNVNFAIPMVSDEVQLEIQTEFQKA